MISKTCRICKGQMMLVDAGLDQNSGKFQRNFRCENDHKGLPSESEAEKRYQLKAIQELNKLVGEIEATTREKGG